MRGNKIVMPEKLWNQTIQLAHEGHQEMVRTKSRLREKVWWPNLDNQVEKLITACYPCQLVGPRPKPEPIRSTPLPRGPWSEIAVNLLEIPKKGHLFFFSWPLLKVARIAFLTKTDAGTVIKCLQSMFYTHGLPETLRSDNGPPVCFTRIWRIPWVFSTRSQERHPVLASKLWWSVEVQQDPHEDNQNSTTARQGLKTRSASLSFPVSQHSPYCHFVVSSWASYGQEAKR